MQMSKKPWWMAAALGLVVITAQAEEVAGATTEMTAAPVVQETASPAAQAASGQLPQLLIKWDCGNCEVNDKVIPLLQQRYTEAVAQAGKQISSSDTAEVSITDYRQRNPAARVMLGFMAGKDRLGVAIKYKGKQFLASDYSANAMQGMNALCDLVAKLSFEKLLAASQS